MRPLNKNQLIDLLMENEPDATQYIETFMSLVEPSVGIIRYFDKENDYFGDEPNFLAYRADLSPTKNFSSGGYKNVKAEGGRSFNQNEAKISALFEGAERYSLSIYNDDDLVSTSYNHLIGKGKTAANPLDYVSSENKTNKKLLDTKMRWTTAWSISHEKEIYIPAQCIYLPYQFEVDEPVLRDPLTTGAASGLSLGKAILRAILEVVERDATMIIHYRKIECRAIEISQLSNALKSVIASLERYKLNFEIYDYTLDIPVPIVVCKITDSSGIGPSCTLGAKASFNLESAILGAILEAGCLRVGIRNIMEEARKEALIALKDYRKLETANRRSFLWSQPEMTHYLNYQDKSQNKSSRFSGWTEIGEEKIANLIEVLLEKGHDIIIKDVTTNDIKTFGIKVVKVVVPGLQPMHLYEPDQVFTTRLLEFDNQKMELGALNPIPHPFG